MLQAQRWDATDPDACVVLGVLYNVSRDYDSAAEAFRRAIEARPNEHSLWNKVHPMGWGRRGGEEESTDQSTRFLFSNFDSKLLQRGELAHAHV